MSTYPLSWSSWTPFSNPGIVTSSGVTKTSKCQICYVIITHTAKLVGLWLCLEVHDWGCLKKGLGTIALNCKVHVFSYYTPLNTCTWWTVIKQFPTAGLQIVDADITNWQNPTLSWWGERGYNEVRDGKAGELLQPGSMNMTHGFHVVLGAVWLSSITEKGKGTTF